ncbi:MAG: hypothetical protein CBE33_05300 [Candidatus Pelagibacter sp. TMED273]|nr:MAG: hypothetical protein CBE33_05300 [Candidatus Pelagibacter sp. TMED273]|tara:strand:+ start:3750 stop:5477 length:1728 start_codon:yes stop_codon:yes gene_type:complete
MAQKAIIQVDIQEGAAKKDLKDLKQGIDKVNKAQVNQTKATKEASKEMVSYGGAVDGVTGGAVTKFRALSGGIKAATASTKAFRIALIATGIGAFVVAIGTLVANLQNSEAGFNRVQKLLKQIGVVAGNVTDIFFSLGTSLFGLVTGDFELMTKSFDEATDRIKNFGEETKKEIKIQGDLSDQQAELTKIERQLTVDRAEANRKRASLLEKSADRENFTAKERIKFLEEAAKIDEEITNEEIKAAEIRLNLKVEENKLSESSKEDLDEEARLKAELTNLETARLRKQRAVTAQITTALREEQAERKAIRTKEEAEQKAEDAKLQAKIEKEKADELTRLDAIDKVQEEFRLKKEDEEAILESEKLELEQARKLQELDNLNATEEQKAGVISFFGAKIQDAKDKEAKQEQAREELLAKQKLAVTANTLGQVSQLLGENSAAGKAAAIAQAIINSYLGFTEVLKTPTTIPEPLGSIQKAISAASILASGLQTVRQITSVKTPNTGGGGISVGGGRGSTAAPTSATPPAFNVVGASDTNQLAEAINGREQKPVKAFVVSSDVSNAQSLDRNIIETASIG